MRIWLITIGEPLPCDGANVRLLRTGILSRILASRGHEVTWWTSAFDHNNKRWRATEDREIEGSEGWRTILLNGRGYKRNVSLRRLLDHRALAKKFTTLAQHQTPPDVILCSMPGIELSEAAALYGRQRNVPVVIDIRDLWPDLFVEVLPRPLQQLGNWVLFSLHRALRRALSEATGILGLTQEFLEWGLRKAGKTTGRWDRVFPMGYLTEAPDTLAIQEAGNRWDAADLGEGRPIVCFFGTIGRQFDLAPVIGAARILREEGLEFQFVLCGDGESRGKFESMSSDCPNVRFPGWVGRSDIVALMSRAVVGLAPYVDTLNFNLNLPNKPIEYMSAGLPVLSSVKGALGRLITTEECGATYGSAEELAAILRRLYQDKSELERLSENALALYKARFVAENVYSEMADYLEEMAKTGREGNGR